jgi:putative acetyltransferase
VQIRVDELRGAEIIAFLQEHLRDMRGNSPIESCHVLDLEGLRRPEITFWSAWEGSTLMGCAALKRLDAGQAELKSMRTAPAARGKGVGSAILSHVLAEAAARGYGRVSLETGAGDFFAPARALYEKFGFVACGPFADYADDPNSAYYTKTL